MTAAARLAGLALVVLTAAAGSATAQEINAPGAVPAAPLAILVNAPPTSDRQQRVDALRELVRLTEPVEVTLDAGQDARELLRQRCGTVRSEELQLLREINPSLIALVADRQTRVRMPPCPFSTGRATVVIPKGGVVSHAVQASMGVWGPETRDKIEALNPGVDLDRVKENQLIVVPYTTRSVSFRLRDEFQAAPEAAIERLKSSLGAQVVAELRLVRPVATGGQPAGGCAAIAQLAQWPFDAARVVQILRQNAAHRAGPLHPVIAAVADTGIERGETRLPLARTPNEGDDPNIDGDANEYDGDVIGVNLATSKGYPASDPRDPDALHGTHVAALVAGQTLSADLQELAAATIRLKILNLKSLVAVMPGVDEPLAAFSMPPDGLRHALTYAASQRAVVLNLSVESDVRIDDFKNRLGSSLLLTVAAAGNAGKDLDDPNGAPVYPVYYRRDHPDKFITVAAHGPDGTLAPFSNHGRSSVDLAAPGVCIDSFVPGRERQRLNGTSQAAPLVSFTAAALAAEGLSPAVIKRRILMTVDVDRTLPVAAEGRLNIQKALACYDDQIEVDDRGWLRGRLAADTVIDVNGRGVSAASIARVLPRYGEGQAPMKVFVKGRGLVNVEMAPVPDQQIGFEVLGASMPERFAMSRLRDFIPRDCRR